MAALFALWFLLSSDFMATLRSRCGHYILLFFLAGSQPSQIGGLQYFYTWCGPTAKCAARGSLEMQDPKNRHKFAIWASSYNFVGLYLHNEGMYQQSGRKLVKQQYLIHMSSQYGERRPTNG